MNVIQKPFGIQEISFTHPGIDKVHVECLCRLLRADVAAVDLASHCTEYGKLMMRIRPTTPGVDARDLVKRASRRRLEELEHALLSVTL